MRVVIKPGGIAMILLLIVGLAGGIFFFRPKSQAAVESKAVASKEAIPVDISRLYNIEGIYTDGTKFTSKGMDGLSAVLSGTLLTTTKTWDGIPFHLGAPNVRNVVIAQGQQITMPRGNYSSLYMMGMAAGSGALLPDMKFTVTYTDGTTKSFTQGISDWFAPQNYPGETRVVSMPYRNVGTGVKDARVFNAYGYKFPLDSTKTIQSFVIPNQSDIKILAITLGP